MQVSYQQQGKGLKSSKMQTMSLCNKRTNPTKLRNNPSPATAHSDANRNSRTLTVNPISEQTLLKCKYHMNKRQGIEELENANPEFVQ